MTYLAIPSIWTPPCPLKMKKMPSHLKFFLRTKKSPHSLGGRTLWGSLELIQTLIFWKLHTIHCMNLICNMVYTRPWGQKTNKTIPISRSFKTMPPTFKKCHDPISCVDKECKILEFPNILNLQNRLFFWPKSQTQHLFSCSST